MGEEEAGATSHNGARQSYASCLLVFCTFAAGGLVVLITLLCGVPLIPAGETKGAEEA